MFSCNRLACCAMLASGAAFLLSALVDSFWFSFLLGAALLTAAVLFRRP